MYVILICFTVNSLSLSLSLALSIHHVRKSKAVATEREVHTLKMKLQEIMKGLAFNYNTIPHPLLHSSGNFDYFMQKEIFEQTESVMNTMRGRVMFDDYKGIIIE